MVKVFLLALTVLLTIVLTPPASIADVDCSPLDPRASLSKEREGKISTSVNTVYKLAKVGISIDGKLKDEIFNLQNGANITEQGQIKFRLLYLCCEMVAKDKGIPAEKKIDLIGKMMKIGNEIKSTSKRAKANYKIKKYQHKTDTETVANEAGTIQTPNLQSKNKASKSAQVSVVGGDYVAGNKIVNNSLGIVEIENIVRRTAQELKPELIKRYNENYTVFAIDKNGLVIPKGSVPDGIDVNWKSGAAKYYDNEIVLVLPDIKISRSNISFCSEYAVMRGISKKVNNQTYTLVAMPGFNIELQVLGIDKDIVIVGLGFPLTKQVLNGKVIQTAGCSGITMSGSSMYTGGKNSYAELLKDYPDISAGRKSILREIVSDILGVDYATNASANQLVDAFSRISKGIVGMRYIKTNCLNSGGLGALRLPTPIVDENNELTEIGIAVLTATAKDIKLGKAKF